MSGKVPGEYEAMVFLVEVPIRAALVFQANTMPAAVQLQDALGIRNRGIFAWVPDRYCLSNIHYHI